MTTAQFDVERPQYIRDAHWASIEIEISRLQRSLDAKDGSEALSNVKCLVECVAKIVLETNGTPAGNSDPYTSVLKQAHSLLKGTRGEALANDSVFGNLATQAQKIAGNLGEIRNEYGGGHGRANRPELSDEMVRLALDGGLLWTRWALRRLGYFSEGQPTSLIEDLTGQRMATFYTGSLERRLIAANLPSLQAQHQRAIGVAVGQRAAGGTFVVYGDGVEKCFKSDDLNTWPAEYRIGLTKGLWFGRDGKVTLNDQYAIDALLALDPIRHFAEQLMPMLQDLQEALTRNPRSLKQDTITRIWERSQGRAEGERKALQYLAYIAAGQQPPSN